MLEKYTGRNEQELYVHNEREKCHNIQTLHPQDEYILQTVRRHKQQSENQVRNRVQGYDVLE